MTRAADRILRAAMHLFTERGYAATTTRAIADAAGVNEVTLFRHFGNKAGVLAAIGEGWDKGQNRPPLDPTDVPGSLLDHALAEVAEATRKGGFMLRMAFDAASVPEVASALASSPGPGGELADLAEFFADAAARGTVRSDVAPRVLAEGFVAMTSSPVMYRQLMGITDGDAAEAVRAWVDIFCRGVMTDVAGSPRR